MGDYKKFCMVDLVEMANEYMESTEMEWEQEWPDLYKELSRRAAILDKLEEVT